MEAQKQTLSQKEEEQFLQHKSKIFLINIFDLFAYFTTISVFILYLFFPLYKDNGDSYSIIEVIFRTFKYRDTFDIICVSFYLIDITFGTIATICCVNNIISFFKGNKIDKDYNGKIVFKEISTNLYVKNNISFYESSPITFIL
ncbi:MAG: hypothetical protein J6C97_02875, partial [Clostridia bacterium]|nr:hypothetical protein [Clostridia bacterium]